MHEHIVCGAPGAGIKVLITAVFICNLITLALVPGLSLMRTPEELLHLTPYENLLELPLRLAVCFLFAWRWAWEAGSYSTVLTVFLLFCGSCTAVLLWQGGEYSPHWRPPSPSGVKTRKISAGRRCAAFSLQRHPWFASSGVSGFINLSGRF